MMALPACTPEAAAELTMATSTLQWHDATRDRPDSDTTVLIHHPDSDEPTWLGFHDGEDWYCIDGMPAQVQHWAHLPAPGRD